MGHVRWADQDLLHGALMTIYGEIDPNVRPQGLHVMDHTWNLEMCRSFYGLCERFDGNKALSNSIGLLHFNCGKSEGNWWETIIDWPHWKKCLLKRGVTGLP